MTFEKLKKIPFRFVSHLSMEDEHATIYISEDGRIGFCDHVKYKNGQPTKRARRHWQIDGKVYKTTPKIHRGTQRLQPQNHPHQKRKFQITGTMKQLNSTLWSVAKEYARLVGQVIGQEPEFWVAEDISVSCCCFGDVWFLTLEEMQIIIDHMPKWLARYGTRQAVGQEITDWLDWTIEDSYDPDRDQYRRHARINLWSWLTGLRPEDIEGKTTSADEIALHHDIIHALEMVRSSYGSAIPLGEAIGSITARLQELEARKKLEDDERFKNIRDTEEYKEFLRMIEEKDKPTSAAVVGCGDKTPPTP